MIDSLSGGKVRRHGGLRWIVALLILLMLGACAGATDDQSASQAVETRPPSTAPPSSETPAQDECPNYAAKPLEGETTIADTVEQEQERLNEDLNRIQEYGRSHPDEFGFVRFSDGPQVQLVVGFTEDVMSHCSTLRDLVEYPDDLVVTEASATAAALESLYADLTATAETVPQITSVSLEPGAVDVHLRSDAEDIAERLLNEHGSLVSITVGFLPYPDPTSGGRVECNVTYDPDAQSTDALDVSLSLESDRFQPGDLLAGVVVVTNKGADSVQLDASQPLLIIVLDGDGVSVATQPGPIAGVGRTDTILPGESIEIRALGSTAPCTSRFGYSLTPGTYQAVVSVGLADGSEINSFPLEITIQKTPT